MTICASCGRENEDHYKYCLGCGSNLDDQRAAAEEPAASPRFCPSCGSDISPGQRFCGACGFKLEASGSGSSGSAPAASGSVSPVPSASSGSQPTAGAEPEPEPTPAEESGRAVGALVMVNPDGTAGESAPLLDGKTTVGRSSSHDVFSRDPFLSPVHATFEFADGKVRVTDEKSLNGVFYRITEVTEIQHGDHVRIGQELLRFSVLELEEPMVPSPDDGTVVAGSDPGGAWGRLDRMSSPDRASFAYLLGGAEVVLGRERGDVVFRDDGYVSGKHARIFQDGGRYFVEDLNSSNGTFLRVRGETTLHDGALILLGRQPFRVQLGGG